MRDVAGVDGAEAAHLERRIEADVLGADAGAEGVVRRLHRVVVGLLRQGAASSTKRRGHRGE